MSRGKQNPFCHSVGCLLPLQPFPSSYVATHLPFSKRHPSFGLEKEGHRLCLNHSNGGPARPLHGHPAPSRGASFALSSCSTPPNRGDFWTPGATLTNQTVRGSHAALITAVCRSAKDRVNQSDLAGNHSMLFKVNAFVIYKKFPAWSFVWEKKKSYDIPPSLLPKGKSNAKNVP